MKEIWKDIKEFEGLYQVSNLGRVKSLKYGRELILKPRLSRGYPILKLYKDGKCIDTSVHRLVAQAFIPNPDNLPEVNHIDEDRSNSRVDNLEWCSKSYNINYGNRTTNATTKIVKRIIQSSTNGKVLALWRDTISIEEVLGYSKENIERSCITSIPYEGYVWRYKNRETF